MKRRTSKPPEWGKDTEGNALWIARRQEFCEYSMVRPGGLRDLFPCDEGPAFEREVAQGSVPMWRRIARVKHSGLDQPFFWARSDWQSSRQAAQNALFLAGSWPQAYDDGRVHLLYSRPA